MIRSEQELFKLMMEDLRKTMTRLSDKILKRWRELIMQNWYEAHDESPYYTRTYEFVESLTSTGLMPIKNGYEVLIYFDTNMMSVKPNGLFIQHEDRMILPSLIEHGYEVFGKKIDGAYYFEDLIEELGSRNYFLDELMTEFGTEIKIKIK